MPSRHIEPAPVPETPMFDFSVVRELRKREGRPSHFESCRLQFTAVHRQLRFGPKDSVSHLGVPVLDRLKPQTGGALVAVQHPSVRLVPQDDEDGHGLTARLCKLLDPAVNNLGITAGWDHVAAMSRGSAGVASYLDRSTDLTLSEFLPGHRQYKHES